MSVFDNKKCHPEAQPELEIVRLVPLSRAQERIWIASHYSPDRTAYNVAFAWKMQGKLSVAKFEAAFQAVMNRHEALRTAFYVDDMTKKPIQAVLRAQPIDLESRYTASEDVHAEFLNFRHHVFDLHNGKTLKAALLRVHDSLSVFMLCYHHIIMDGVSLGIFLHDLNDAYISPNSSRTGVVQCPDYALYETKMLGGGELANDTAYWKNQFNQTIETLPLLPFARVNSRHSLAASNVFTAHAFVKKETVARIKSASMRSQSSPFHLYTAALQVLMYELLDKSVHEFCFGMADANRLDEKYLHTVGFFLNLLPLKLKVSTNDSFAQLVRDTRNTTYGALAHSKMPFDALLQELDVPRSVTHNPLFQVLINYTIGIAEINKFAGCDMDMVEIEDARTACDLVVSIVETPGKDTAISFTMPLSLYLGEDCSRIIELYVDLLDGLSRAPDTKISEVRLFPESIQLRESGTGLGPVVEWEGWESTISKQVDAIVGRCPAETAVKMAFSDEYLSYAHLGDKSAKCAQVLSGLGVSVSSRVAVLSEPTIDNVVNILAMLQLGGTYIPLDPRNPHDRLSSIIQDSQPSLIISDGKWFNTAAALGHEHGIQVASSDDICHAGSTAASYKTNESNPDLTAAILYTSGSTGKPKGVVLNHRGFVNQFAALTQQYGLGQEVVMQQSSPGFDITIEQMFIALCLGGKVVLVPSTIRGDAVKLSKLILEEKITYTIGVPSEYTVMLDHGAEFLQHCEQWKYVFCGGERMTDRLRQAFHALALPKLKLINVYGPTETTVSCCRGIISLDMGNEPGNYDFYPVGQVLPNYSVYIVGQNGQILPAGFPGEIFIGGVGVGKGYLNRKDLTNNKFLPDTFSPVSQRRPGVVYRTGDRGRLLNDNTVVFLGRLEGDTQIKLRGQRVELDEIANALLQASRGTLAAAVVTARGGVGSDLFLVAFVVFDKGADINSSGKIAYLQQLRQALALPKYMWPSRVMALDQLPLSLNGKVDRTALNSIQLHSAVSDKDAVSALSLAERDVLALWQEVLPDGVAGGIDIRPETDFFEAGGNSLQLVRLQALIQKNMGVAIPLVEMVEFCSLESMARRVKSYNRSYSIPTVAWEEEASVPDLPEAHLSNINRSAPRERETAPKVILLTGASGFLGHQLLEHLVASDDVYEVHCIAIRSSSSLEKIQALNSPKIITYRGDLTLPLLGLQKAEAEFLSSHIDAILHNGADVSFMKSYNSLKKANVDSTKELIRLSAPRRVPIHYISSAGVAGFVPPARLPLHEVSIAPYPPAESGAHGYQSSKWVSERLLEKASALYSMSVTIHRPTGIIGDGAPSTDIVANFLTYSKMLFRVPDMQGWDGYFDFVDVKKVADKVSSSLTRIDNHQEPAVTVIHEYDWNFFLNSSNDGLD
ncbi:Nonribosomal peptide synthetase [Tolypocladium capitatum]|uniref:Nonribosomal peptide synthetase n=1 Tax=Tolypocladium capitatum TaxID=45235 RepID=A0A2K3QDJ6_9HYPO|nr:Nonribosomal peptide synthetase [Tolypocladium capitatum]